MNTKYLIGILLAFFLSINISAQTADPEWDDTQSGTWSVKFKQVDITSSTDGKTQKVYLYSTASTTPKPLIVSLHTWSGNYRQKDPLTAEILARDWNYIRPNFRGKNDKPEAMGSPLVISDIEDAIKYALEHTNADPNEVHIIGTSGGGYATLLAYMNVAYAVKSFSAWVPISDIEAWYWESTGRKQKYSDDIFKATSSDSILNAEESRRRSPLYQAFPIEKREDAKLYIYAGIHDGYTGSVPITHSLFMYNRLVGEIKYNTTDKTDIFSKANSDSELVSEIEVIDLLSKRTNPNKSGKKLFGRDIHLQKRYGNIQLTVFEGDHEQIPQALGLIPYEKKTKLKYNVLTIGDSNAHSKSGWVTQLKKMMPESSFVNLSQSGRTIGFDNLNREKLNALKQIDSLMDEAQEKFDGKKVDVIIVCLGTNDTKKEFADRQSEVIPNFDTLLKKIKNHSFCKKSKPLLIYVTPPPIREKNIEAKYESGNERLKQLYPALKTTAQKNGFVFVDVFYPMQGVLDYYANDGIHMVGEGQEIIALQIVEALRKLTK